MASVTVYGSEVPARLVVSQEPSAQYDARRVADEYGRPEPGNGRLAQLLKEELYKRDIGEAMSRWHAFSMGTARDREADGNRDRSASTASSDSTSSFDTVSVGSVRGSSSSGVSDVSGDFHDERFVSEFNEEGRSHDACRDDADCVREAKSPFTRLLDDGVDQGGDAPLASQGVRLDDPRIVWKAGSPLAQLISVGEPAMTHWILDKDLAKDGFSPADMHVLAGVLANKKMGSSTPGGIALRRVATLSRDSAHAPLVKSCDTLVMIAENVAHYAGHRAALKQIRQTLKEILPNDPILFTLRHDTKACMDDVLASGSGGDDTPLALALCRGDSVAVEQFLERGYGNSGFATGDMQLLLDGMLFRRIAKSSNASRLINRVTHLAHHATQPMLKQSCERLCSIMMEVAWQADMRGPLAVAIRAQRDAAFPDGPPVDAAGGNPKRWEGFKGLLRAALRWLIRLFRCGERGLHA